MKRVLLIIFTTTAILTVSNAARAAGKFGIGFVLGSPSAITGKFFMDGKSAIDFGVGVISDDLYIYGDYLAHFHGVTPLDGLAIYFGVGCGYHDYEHHDHNHHHDDENRLEARVPIGLEYTFSKVPLGIFLELVPALQIVPDTDFHVRGGLGVRYYF